MNMECESACIIGRVHMCVCVCVRSHGVCSRGTVATRDGGVYAPRGRCVCLRVCEVAGCVVARHCVTQGRMRRGCCAHGEAHGYIVSSPQV